MLDHEFIHPDPREDLGVSDNRFKDKLVKEISDQESIDIEDIEFPKPTSIVDVCDAAISLISNRVSYAYLSNSLSETFDEFIPNINIPFELTREFSEPRDIDIAAQIIKELNTDTNSLNYDLYKVATKKNYKPIMRIYEEYALRAPSYNPEQRDMLYVIMDKVNTNNDQFVTGYDNLYFETLNNFISLCKYGTAKNELHQNIHNTHHLAKEITNIRNGEHVSPDIYNLSAAGGAMLLSSQISNNHLKSAEGVLNFSSYIAIGDNLMYAILHDLFNVLNENVDGIAKFKKTISDIKNIAYMIKGFMYLMMQGDIESILGFLGRFDSNISSISSAVSSFSVNELMNTLIDINGPMRKVCSLINKIGIKNFPMTSSVVKSGLSKLINDFEGVLREQQRRILKALNLSQIKKDISNSIGKGVSDIAKKTNLIKGIDKLSESIEKVERTMRPSGIINLLKGKSKGNKDFKKEFDKKTKKKYYEIDEFAETIRLYSQPEGVTF